jgi:hypothetical protein
MRSYIYFQEIRRHERPSVLDADDLPPSCCMRLAKDGTAA